MKPEILKAVAEGAKTLVGETEGLEDALQYCEQLADDTNTDLNLGYVKGSGSSYSVLYKECDKAIREASRRK